MTSGQICPREHAALLPCVLRGDSHSTVAVLRMSPRDDSHIPLQPSLNIFMQGKLQRFSGAESNKGNAILL